MAPTWILIFFLTFAACHSPTAGDPQTSLEHDQSGQRIRRFIYFHSRPHPKADEERGIGFTGHLSNLLKGGSLGVEFHMPKSIDKYMERWGKKVPFLSKPDMADNERMREKENDWEDVERELRSDYGGQIDPRKNP